ncbi:hypothetical protein KIPB_012365, partial [Kipferlia bialata]
TTVAVTPVQTLFSLPEGALPSLSALSVTGIEADSIRPLVHRLTLDDRLTTLSLSCAVTDSARGGERDGSERPVALSALLPLCQHIAPSVKSLTLEHIGVSPTHPSALELPYTDMHRERQALALRSISLSHCSLDVDALIELLQTCPKLKSVSLSNVHLTSCVGQRERGGERGRERDTVPAIEGRLIAALAALPSLRSLSLSLTS